MTIKEESEKDFLSHHLSLSAKIICPVTSKGFSACLGYFRVPPSLFPVLGDISPQLHRLCQLFHV